MTLSQVAQILGIPQIDRRVAKLLGLSGFLDVQKLTEDRKMEALVEAFDNGGEMIESMKDISYVPRFGIATASAMPNKRVLPTQIEKLDYEAKGLIGEVKLEFKCFDVSTGEEVPTLRLRYMPLQDLVIHATLRVNNIPICEFELRSDNQSHLWKDISALQSRILGISGLISQPPPKELAVASTVYSSLPEIVSSLVLSQYVEALMSAVTFFEAPPQRLKLFWWRPLRAAILQSMETGQTAAFIAPRSAKTSAITALSEAFNVMCGCSASPACAHVVASSTIYPTCSDLKDDVTLSKALPGYTYSESNNAWYYQLTDPF